MTYAMLKPPKHFEELVTAHFRQNGSAILTACKAYMDGRARVGELAGNGSSRTTSVSSKFKTSMDVIYPKLLMLLAKIEASVESFEQQLKEERLCDPAVIAKPMIVKKKIGFAKNIFKVVRKLLKSSKKQNASKSVS
ncbi:hypothetical protein GIB67_014718 [Kingdonia uniflora]|uniref:Uncharacterized protein n=1 Tax=Kingdonia uniflora TaxID=39325 RepID=A0A7J7NUN5_9MAGN|nr:hypothetical protein GIB67_014718 [Kingdonia uniflora]